MVIARGCKDRSYGVPWPCIVLNVAGEAFFSFGPTHAKLHGFFLYGNRFWFCFDVAILYQFARFGRDAQTAPRPKNWCCPLIRARGARGSPPPRGAR